MLLKSFHHLLFFCFLILVLPQIGKAQETVNSADLQMSNRLESEFYFVEGMKYFMLEEYKKAIPPFKEALKKSDTPASIHYQLAYAYFHLKQPIKALEEIENALRLEKSNEYFYALGADIYVGNGMMEKAEDCLRKRIALQPEIEGPRIDLALFYEASNKKDKALEIYKDIDARFGVSYGINKRKVSIYLENNQLDKAKEAHVRLLNSELFPSDVSMVLVQQLVEWGFESDACFWANKWVKKQPLDAHWQLIASKCQGDTNGSNPFVTLELAFAETGLTAENRWESLKKLKSSALSQPTLIPLGLKLSQMAVNLHAEHAGIWECRGFFLAASGKWKEAREAFRNSLAKDPDQYELFLQLLEADDWGGTLEELRADIMEASDIFPLQIPIRLFKAKQYLWEGDYDKCIELLSSCKEWKGSNGFSKEVLYVEAFCYLKQKKQKEALDNLNQWENPSSFAEIRWFLRAIQLLPKDKRSNFLSLVVKSNQSQLNAPDRNLWEGVIEWMKESPSKAQELWSKQIEIQPIASCYAWLSVYYKSINNEEESLKLIQEARSYGGLDTELILQID